MNKETGAGEGAGHLVVRDLNCLEGEKRAIGHGS